ncbi:helix-turn-helix transcriptional regulator [Sphingobacterium multivorum]|uniref:helix-turn-helix transcriptional regulator n=1 Tax=Sphingobacterium multivorum TaxID=28454 RepID=UPI00142E3F79|nr:AraC family transcriptional regulator [Sphingobacterium multivorum]QQT46843.1 helix-turn-helix transcriptional regulator [Sphingobacterium multivorum]QQT60618.1 helix-turn-helix transcriptional regulator [Sphingobacterium multivorum]
MINNEKNKLDFTLLNIGYAEHQADWNFKDIKSPFARIHYVSEGEAAIIANDEVIKLRPGHLYLTPAYVHHSYDCSDKLSLYYIHIYENPEIRSSIFDRYTFPKEIKSDQLLKTVIQHLYALNPGRELKIYDPKSYDNSIELMKNMALQTASPFARASENQAIIHLLMSRFLSEATNKIPQVEKRLLRVLDYIDENIHHPISIEQLANQIFISKDHLIRLFKKHINTTPVNYINQKKIEKAQLMMLVDEDNIQQLCFRLGFENISYFNRLFKKLTGETPMSYKRRISR